MMHTIPPPVPAAEGLDDPQVVLRDGTVATVRPSQPADVPELRRFFHDLSPESRYRRFCSVGEPSDSVLASLTDSADPARGLTFLVERWVEDQVRIIAVASYQALGPEVAEVSFAVADAFHGRGLATILLERLAAAALRAGFHRFVATALSDNTQMLDVFRDSGFEIRSKSEGGTVEVRLGLELSRRGFARDAERERLATTASLRPLLEPEAVAVIGASRDPSSIGRRVLDALRTGGFKGQLYAVNPRATEISGLRAVRSARELPHGVSLAVIAVPAVAVLAVVDDCAAAGVRSLVVISAGFAEASASGRELQQKLVEKVRGYGMRMVGPNCMGVLNANPAVRLNASFSPVFPPGGHVGLLSQSGALGLAILHLAEERRLGLSTFVSVGNKADVSGNDLLQYWEGDPNTRVILFYLESFGNPRRFGRLARRISREKPIVVVKAGRTAAGARAAGSHTAALAANEAGVEALFRQSGVIRAETLNEMLDLAACLDSQPLPRGPRVAIVTNAGGPGILAADACAAGGLVLAEFAPATKTRLASHLPALASPTNPVDMIASARPDDYRRTIEHTLAAEEVDSLIVIFTPVDLPSAGQILEAIRDGVARGRRRGGSGKPVLTCVMGEAGRPACLELENERLPGYAFPENAARALAKVTAYAGWRSQPPGLLWGFDDLQVEEARRICHTALDGRGDAWLTADEVRGVMSAFNLPVIPTGFARTADEADALARRFGFPIVAKIASPRIQHKTDIGGVRLNLRSSEEVRLAFADLMALAAPAGEFPADHSVMMQPMVSGGVETMMGISADPLFGHLVGFGLGGIHVEILGDVQFRAAPLTDRDVEELLHGIRGSRLLEGYRGHPPADVKALREVLLRLSRLAEEVPEIAELDLNPVIALRPGQGCRIVDARIRVKPIYVQLNR